MKLSEEQIQDRLTRAAGWKREGDEIVRDFAFENFKQAMHFVNQVADLAESADHHPDILVHGWNKVRLRLMTHNQGGLTNRDFGLAEKISSIL